MSIVTAARLADAAKARKAMLAKIRKCRCAWPIQVYRNGDGHHDECPAHAARSVLPVGDTDEKENRDHDV